jgi:sortase A
VRRAFQIIGWTLIWSGVFVFGFLGWELFVTDLFNAQDQAQASEALDEQFVEDRQFLSPEVYVSPTEPDREIEYFPEDDPEPGDGFARIIVSKVGLDAVIFEGVDTETLKLGPGHMPGTALPGQPGNAVVSGHRTTYGRPFYDFDLLEQGDRIVVETVIGKSVYEVRASFVVAPTDVWVTAEKGGAWLTMTTCNPKFSARERLIITAELVSGPNLEYVEQLSP